MAGWVGGKVTCTARIVRSLKWQMYPVVAIGSSGFIPRKMYLRMRMCMLPACPIVE
jgi:hypothetical protein